MTNTIRVLVVDDDEDDVYLITEALRDVERTRYVITTASSSLLAMVKLSKASFDVIFSDYRLGAVTGVDFIESVRAAGIQTPIILLTGISDHVVDNAALKAGSSDFIPKNAASADVLDRSVRYALAHADRQSLMQSILKNTKSGIYVMNARIQCMAIPFYIPRPRVSFRGLILVHLDMSVWQTSAATAVMMSMSA